MPSLVPNFWSLEKAVNDPLFFLALHLDNAFSYARRFDKKYILKGGPNFAVRASSYATIGGYNDEDSLGEDLMFVKRLGLSYRQRMSSSATGQRQIDYVKICEAKIKCAGVSTRLYTSTRRARAAYEQGNMPCPQWSTEGDTPFRLEDAKIRTVSEAVVQELDITKPTAAEVEHIINASIKCFFSYSPVIPANSRALRKYLTLVLGIESSIRNMHSVEVTSIEKFWEQFQEFRAYGLEKQKVRLERVY